MKKEKNAQEIRGKYKSFALLFILSMVCVRLLSVQFHFDYFQYFFIVLLSTISSLQKSCMRFDLHIVWLWCDVAFIWWSQQLERKHSSDRQRTNVCAYGRLLRDNLSNAFAMKNDNRLPSRIMWWEQYFCCRVLFVWSRSSAPLLN